MSRTCWWSETVIPGHYIRDSSTSCRAKFKTRDRIVPSLFSSPSHLPIPWVCSLRGKLLLHNYLPWVNATGCVHNRFFFMDLELCIFIFPGCCLACMVAWAGKILWLFCLLISSLTGFFFRCDVNKLTPFSRCVLLKSQLVFHTYLLILSLSTQTRTRMLSMYSLQFVPILLPVSKSFLFISLIILACSLDISRHLANA